MASTWMLEARGAREISRTTLKTTRMHRMCLPAQHWERDGNGNATRDVRTCRMELQTQNSLIALKIELPKLTGRWKRASVGEASAYAPGNTPFGSPGECGLNVCIQTSGEWRQGVGRK
ncbi:hypothetical protein SCLCIDRAFT_1220268 [Scleroderma citrinum Foug A]|uniref:Uncharacterized protein n=1 Tax=Scleroderma citrinum Foug A TaxID=1036808 RepID=A0A0C2ZVR4_9AGAM|nr:hypothetical protein SCLCIDRAFT_1220268 [Scleroderma citrinum Foug A]